MTQTAHFARFGRGHSHISARTALPLSDEQLRGVAPSVFAAEAWQGMSNRYLFVPTIEVINRMRGAGLQPIRAAQSRSRIEGKGEFTKHMIVFRRAGDPARIGDTVPEVVLVNSHDGTSSYQIHAGLFRLVCTNGLIVADSMFDAVRCKHAARMAEEIIEGTFRILDEAPRLESRVNQWRRTALTQQQQQAFAEAALTLRWDAEREEHAPVQAHRLLTTRRPEDAPPTLWNTFNRLQENLIRGGLHGRGSTGKRTTTRAVAGVSENVRLNRALWVLAERLGDAVQPAIAA